MLQKTKVERTTFEKSASLDNKLNCKVGSLPLATHISAVINNATLLQ